MYIVYFEAKEGYNCILFDSYAEVSSFLHQTKDPFASICILPVDDFGMSNLARSAIMKNSLILWEDLDP